MNGNLEPEENVMDNSVSYPGKVLGKLAIALETLGWDYGDDVAIEIAGTQSLVLMLVKCTIRSGSLRLALVSTTKMPSLSLRINLVEI